MMKLHQQQPEMVKEQVPPQAVEAEVAVLGAILQDREALLKALEVLKPEHFYREAHRKIYAASISLFERNEPVDLVTLSYELACRKELEEVGGAKYMTDLCEGVPSAANVAYYARIVRKRSVLREMINTMTVLREQAYAEEDPQGLLDEAKRRLEMLSGDGMLSSVEAVEDAEVEGLPAFPEIAWRSVFNTYRKATAGTSECADVFRFSTFWTLAAVRLRRRVWIHYAYPHYPNVYILIFAPTGEGKTTPMRQSAGLLPDDGRVKVLRGRASGEALADWLTQSEDGMLVSHLMILEELATLLASSKWEGATIVPFLTEVFDCPDHHDLKFRKNPVSLKEPTVSILAGTTPEWFWKSMREVDIHGGFGNRFLYLTGSPQAPLSMPPKPDVKLLDEVKAALNALEQLEPCEVALAPDALALWNTFYQSWRTTELDPLTRAATKRVTAYILKLAMVYAALERTVPTITVDQLTAAIAVGHYAANCTARLMGQHHAQSVEGQLEEAIRRFLRERDHTKRGLKNRLGGRVRATLFNRVLEAMVRSGEVLERSGFRHGQVILSLAGRG